MTVPERVSLNRQIQCVERELRKRPGVYARQVGVGRMRQSVAELEIGDMQAVLATLRWLQKYEDKIRAAIGDGMEPEA